MKPKPLSVDDPIHALVVEVLKSRRYKYINPDLVRRLATLELLKRSSFKEAAKAVKNKIHQVSGAYFERPIDYNYWLAEIKSARMSGDEDFRRVCKQAMCYHSSTRERLPILDQFYNTLLPDLFGIHRVFDVACGLNPLAIPWMNLPPDIEYIAVDICADMVAFLNGFFQIAGVNGKAIVGDVIWSCPVYSADIAFLLKSIPCLEQVDKAVGVRLLTALDAKYIVVSFPSHSLSGRRDKGMLQNYAVNFADIVKDREWDVKKIEFETELVFVVSKNK